MLLVAIEARIGESEPFVGKSQARAALVVWFGGLVVRGYEGLHGYLPHWFQKNSGSNPKPGIKPAVKG